MKIINDIEVAKSTLLKRQPAELQEVSDALKEQIKAIFGKELLPQQAVEQIMADVEAHGDTALRDYTKRIDGIALSDLEVPSEEIRQAYIQVDAETVSALRIAAERIRSFHEASKPRSWIDFREGGLGQIISPLEKVGAYVPGGTATYPSTVLMTVIPAKVAGVLEVTVVSPPGKDGKVPASTLVAADIANADRVFRIGGAQAIAALAFGTKSVPKVDKICGPGNIFVQLAKRLAYGTVDIDGLFGPTEAIVIADETANATYCAADLLAQAEHDPLASAILITNSANFATKVNKEIKHQLAKLDRKEIAIASLEARGGIIVSSTLNEAIELANYYAPEHLSLLVTDAWSYLSNIRNAGGIFIGESSPEALGDYIAGPSHVMPTGGTARFRSALNTNDFVKVTSILAINDQTLKTVGPPAATIAKTEGFDGHARALDIRLS